ncbi:unnamed protein product, partial [Darwinula stevensoni]
MRLQYNGSRYQGLQTQPSGQTIQDCLEAALQSFAIENIRIYAAGRTDSGVHALNQVVHFDTQIQNREPYAWVRGLNTFLPSDIAVLWAKPVPDHFHARMCATARSYTYVLYNHRVRPALFAGQVGWCHEPLNLSKMQAAAQHFLGMHDFTSFRASQCQADSPIKTLEQLSIDQYGIWFVFQFKANAFLHHMVRNIMGSLIAVGRGSCEPEWIQTVIAAKNRSLAAPTFMANGLYFAKADYPSEFALPEAMPWQTILGVMMGVMNPNPLTFKQLSEWLAFLEARHPITQIELGLDRVKTVWQELAIVVFAKIITVAGTNGKGSVCQYLSTILRCGGYSVGLYTSPHLLTFNERMNVDGQVLHDDAIIEAFVQVEKARLACDLMLSYFEFTTLAALVAFSKLNLAVWVLEVGLGGRLDAVNVVDADCAVITSIDLDHQAYLGNTREQIGFEKAGIMRPHQAVVCGDRHPPETVKQVAAQLNATLFSLDQDFWVVQHQLDKTHQWDFRSTQGHFYGLAHPALRGSHQLDNAAIAIAALLQLKADLPLRVQSVRQGLAQVNLPGRFQVFAGQPTVILDVGHNPHASVQLRKNIEQMGYT